MGDLLNILQKFPVFKDVNNNSQIDNDSNLKDDDVGFLNYNNSDTIKYYQEKLDVLETYLLSNDMHLVEMLDILDDTVNLQVINENLLPLLFHLISNYHPNFNTLCGSAHRIFRIIIRDNRFYTMNTSVAVDESVEVREEINADTTLRLQIALHYAHTCVNSFPDLIDTNNLALSFGAIIGSLQGGDPTSPEVAVVVCALEFVAERLNETFKTAKNGGVMPLPKSGGGADVGNNRNGTYELEKYICEPLAVILIYGLEMIPSTIVSKLCEIINSIFIGIPKNAEIAFAIFIQQAVQAFGDPSRRALLFRWHLGQGRARM
eukprot:g5265.t1